jgi:uncharacterized peroxidase-related enzyme
MPHIPLPDNVYGIRSLAMYRPETGKPLYELAELLLRTPSTLPGAERELIAAFVSSKNDCLYCCSSHAAASRYLFKSESGVVDLVLENYMEAPISSKLKCLLTIAGKVQKDARTVSAADVENARQEGATDREIHDAVLIAAAFCMYNRYVDGLATVSPGAGEKQIWEEMGLKMGSVGYVLPPPAR